MEKGALFGYLKKWGGGGLCPPAPPPPGSAASACIRTNITTSTPINTLNTIVKTFKKSNQGQFQYPIVLTLEIIFGLCNM